MAVNLSQRHLLATFMLSSVFGAIFSSPVTTTPDPAIPPSNLSSISPPLSSSSSSSSSFIATSSHTSTSISSSSSSSSAESETPQQDASFISEVVSGPSSDATDVNTLVLHSSPASEEATLSKPPSLLSTSDLDSTSEDSLLSNSTHTDEALHSLDIFTTSPVESLPSNQLLTLQTEHPVTSTSHTPLQSENISSPTLESLESFTHNSLLSSSSLSPSSEAPLTTVPSLSTTEASLVNESSLLPVESRSSLSLSIAPEGPEALLPFILQLQEDNATAESETIHTETLHSSKSSSEEFNNLTKEFFSWKLEDSPEYASQVGINEDNAAHLDDLSPENFQQKKLRTEEFLERAKNINATELSEIEALNHRIFIEDLSSFLRNSKYISFFMPINVMGGPHQLLPYILKKATVFESFNDYKKLISRYRDFPRQADQFLEIMRGNMADGLMPSNWSLIGAIDQIGELLVPHNESTFYEPFKHISINITLEQIDALRQEAQPVVEALLSSFRKLRDFIQDEYYPAARPEVGVSSLPGGLEYYQACLQFHTSTNMTPQEVHDVGLSEVDRIHKEVEQTAVDLGMANKTLAQISDVLKKEPEMKFSSKEDLLDSYRSAVYNKIYPLMDQIIDDIPAINVTIEENVAGDGYASYSDPPSDGSRPGTFYLNANIYDHHRRYEITALSLHEAVPGHHLQAILQLGDSSLPEYRKNPDFLRYADIPAKLPMHTAFTEGWGLYSEFLGNELGLYEDPHQRIGRHSFEMLRACRLVVDTGMHALGWSRDKAINYLLENTAMSKKAIENQIDRYITWPGQATAYKIGEIKIRMLREKAEKELGEFFRLQDFHATILKCYGPLNILEECVDTYIQRYIVRNTKNESIIV
ncbi:uncharacterized protein [Palaemon carinicauda]|uniref:uncharacterized protein n=1 Tax=Palaemon carinicauda TaxID=392227 RepID=UPI0035B6A176